MHRKYVAFVAVAIGLIANRAGFAQDPAMDLMVRGVTNRTLTDMKEAFVDVRNLGQYYYRIQVTSTYAFVPPRDCPTCTAAATGFQCGQVYCPVYDGVPQGCACSASHFEVQGEVTPCGSPGACTNFNDCMPGAPGGDSACDNHLDPPPTTWLCGTYTELTVEVTGYKATAEGAWEDISPPTVLCQIPAGGGEFDPPPCNLIRRCDSPSNPYVAPCSTGGYQIACN